jgi:Zn-dependent protease with chaperone function
VIARAIVSLVLALLFGGTVAVSFLVLFAPVGFLGGYDGVALVLILSLLVGLGLAAYTTRTLYRRFRATSADRRAKVGVASNNRWRGP